jgi:hypothetical protein
MYKLASILSTVSWMGGRNDFLGFAYVVVGGLAFVVGLLFAALHAFSGRKPGDTSYLVWNQ